MEIEDTVLSTINERTPNQASKDPSEDPWEGRILVRILARSGSMLEGSSRGRKRYYYAHY
jgi:hypothetical protein